MNSGEATSHNVAVLTGMSSTSCSSLTTTQCVPDNSHMDVDSQSHNKWTVTKHHNTMEAAIQIHRSIITHACSYHCRMGRAFNCVCEFVCLSDCASIRALKKKMTWAIQQQISRDTAGSEVKGKRLLLGLGWVRSMGLHIDMTLYFF